jgi:hypothetical protein
MEGLGGVVVLRRDVVGVRVGEGLCQKSAAIMRMDRCGI